MNDLQATILKVVTKFCTVDSGYCTGELAEFIGRQPGSESTRRHSALVLRELRALEAAGHVRRLDDKKPIVWCLPRA